MPPGRFDKYKGPLCPLDGNFDMSRYLELDGAGERFAEFTEVFAEPGSWTGQGQVVVVTGDRGYGKTSLIQRCAAWMVAEAKRAGHCRVVPVDLTDEVWSDQNLIEDRMALTLKRVVSKLGALLTAADHERLGRQESAAEKFRELGQILVARRDGERPIGVAVLLQGYPRAPEVEAYYGIASRGMFFFAEMFEEDDRRQVGEFVSSSGRRGAGCYVLELDVLKSGDPGKFVTWVNRAGQDWPEVPAEITEFFRGRLVPLGVGMGTMTKVLWGALDIAVKESATILTIDHVAAFYANIPRTPRED